VSAATSPVSRPDGPVIRSESALYLVLPAKASLAHVTGTLQVNGTGRLGGAQVSAIDAAGTAIVVAQVSAANGTFALDLPPGPPAFSLQVGPQAAASANDPVPSFNPKSFPAGQGSDLGTIDLGILPAPATLTGKVVDARGAGVASARVVLLSTGAAGYVLSAQTTTLTDGSFSARVRAGSYLLEVAPDVAPSQPAVSDPVTVQVTPPTTALTVVCPDKIKVDGVVLRADGRPVSAGFRVDATRLPDQLVSGRGTQTTSTDARGAFSLVLDRGRYRAEITPTTDSALPRTISTIDVPATATPVALPPLHISPPLEVLGTVGASAGNNPRVGIPGATIDFYAFDSTGRKSVLIGSAVSDSSGQYKAVLPDVAQFAAQ
jgi:hypothetical protein